ncbi:MAG: PLDc N-terminal domain-containing protein [Actinomycetia bacterium]|nr:PLDc N-terminal domain-containing protein [Actinomycetes bacterium]
MVRVIPIVLAIALAIYALADCIQTDESNVRGIPKIWWIILIVLIAWVGPITWLIAGRERQLPWQGRAQRRGPVGPDDDPDFLRGL